MNGFEILGQLLAGWLFADFVGGLAHWWEDRVAEVRWPIVGPLLIAPNRLHHSDPMVFTRSGFFERNWTTWAATLPFAALLFTVTGFSLFWCSAVLGGLATNQIHYWAHKPPRPFESPLLRALQATGLFQAGTHHLPHHIHGARRYCILTNLLNPFLDALGFWALIERGLARVGMPVNGGIR